MKCIFWFGLVLLATLSGVEIANAGSIILNWNPSPSRQVAGYNVYFGATSGNYPYKVNVGNAKTITISNLTIGATYYFVATAYDTNGRESGYSSEIKVTVSVLLSLLRGANTSNPALIQFPCESGHWYEIQSATTNLRTWTSLWRSGVASANSLMLFTDTGSTASPSRFYRLVVH